MRRLTRDGFIADSLTPAVMHTLVRCLQFADSAESQFRGESTELLLATTALLGSIFQNNRGAVSLFRENEGLTTLLSLLRSRVPQETQHSLSPRESRPRMQSLRSILWVLWECCGDETASCAELAGLEGVSLLLTPFGDARCEILALDALRLTLRQLPLVAQRILPRDILRLLDHLAAPEPREVAAAAALVSTLAVYPRNARLIRLANGVDVLMRVEITAGRRGGVAAAKALCNLLHGGVSLGVSRRSGNGGVVSAATRIGARARDFCATTYRAVGTPLRTIAQLCALLAGIRASR